MIFLGLIFAMIGVALAFDGADHNDWTIASLGTLVTLYGAWLMSV